MLDITKLISSFVLYLPTRTTRRLLGHNVPSREIRYTPLLFTQPECSKLISLLLKLLRKTFSFIPRKVSYNNETS